MIKGFISHSARHKEKGTGFQWQPKTENDIANCLRANAAISPTDNTIKIVGHSGTGGQRGDVLGVDGISSYLTATDFKQPKQILESKLIQVGELDIKGADSTKRVYSADGICPTMTTMGGVTDNPKCFCLL